MPETDPVLEARRVMQICNACRYCESFCAVFPAMNRRIVFGEGDLNYLANLCHGCGSCYYACQYAPPHEFAVHVPRAFAELRVASYRKYTWPAAFARAFEHHSIVVSVITALCLSAFVLGVFLAHDASTVLGAHRSTQSFYAVVPHSAMVWMFGTRGTLRARSLDHRFPAVLARYRREARRLRQAGGPISRSEGRAHAALSRRWRRWMHLSRRAAVVLAARLSPLHILRIHALLCRNHGGHRVPLCVRLGRALLAPQPAEDARYDRRHRVADRTGRAALAQVTGRPGAHGGRQARPRVPGCSCCCSLRA